MKSSTCGLGLLAGLITIACGGSPPDARSPEDAAATDGGGRYEASTEDERLLAQKASTLRAGESLQVGEVKMSASEKYHAASGYECRRVFLETQGQQSLRLACGRKDGWFFVPSVNEDGSAKEAAQAETKEVEVSASGEAHAVSAQAEPALSSDLPAEGHEGQ